MPEHAQPMPTPSVARLISRPASPGQGAHLCCSASEVQRLQRLAGNRAVRAWLTATQSPPGPTVQRNIGFEFENPLIHIRKVAEADTLAALGRAGKLNDDEWPEDAPDPLEAKKPALRLGDGPGTVEADDTLGKGKEDVEVVVPRLAPFEKGFPLTEKGHAAMTAALELASKFAVAAGEKGAANAREVYGQEREARQENAARREAWRTKYGGTRLAADKVLAKAVTSKSKSAPLPPIDDFKKVMKEVKAFGKGKGKLKDKPRVEQGFDRIRAELVRRGLIPPEPSASEVPTFRDLTAVAEFWNGGDDLVLGDAGFAGSRWAVHVTMGIPLRALPQRLVSTWHSGAKPLGHLYGNQIPEAPALDGFMRLVASYLWGAEEWKTKKSSNPKQMVDLLARNNFAALFQLIPKPTRMAIAKQPATWLTAWATDSPDLGEPLIANIHNGLKSDYSRRDWLLAMIGGIDGDDYVPGVDLVATDTAITELDSMGKWEQFDTGKGDEPIPIFEDRLHENWTPADWVARGQQFFRKSFLLQEG
jgi:hypothetical protein